MKSCLIQKIEDVKKTEAMLKYGFHNKSFTYSECTSGQLLNSSHPLMMGAAANLPKADDWNWATDQR